MTESSPYQNTVPQNYVFDWLLSWINENEEIEKIFQFIGNQNSNHLDNSMPHIKETMLINDYKLKSSSSSIPLPQVNKKGLSLDSSDIYLLLQELDRTWVAHFRTWDWTKNVVQVQLFLEPVNKIEEDHELPDYVIELLKPENK